MSSVSACLACLCLTPPALHAWFLSGCLHPCSRLKNRYACVNLSCFVLSILQSPGFRPRWKHYNWFTALSGFTLCLAIMLVVSWKVTPPPLPRSRRDTPPPVLEMRKLDECDMEEFGRLGSSEETIAILGDRSWSQTAKQDGDRISKRF